MLHSLLSQLDIVKSLFSLLNFNIDTVRDYYHCTYFLFIFIRLQYITMT